MAQFIMIFPTWNDMDWLDAQLHHINYWNPDKLYFCEGCWDSKYPARSVDGTFEYLMRYKNYKNNCWVVENIRDDEYRKNQAATLNMVLQLANAKSGDWVMYAAIDAFFFKSAIDLYKKRMEQGGFDYPIFEIYNFWDSTTKYFSHIPQRAPNLPHRLVKGFKFVPTCRLEPDARTRKIDFIKEFHYEGMRFKTRLEKKYDVGDRQSPLYWKSGIKLKKRSEYLGNHPEFVIPVLKEKGYL